MRGNPAGVPSGNSWRRRPDAGTSPLVIRVPQHSIRWVRFDHARAWPVSARWAADRWQSTKATVRHPAADRPHAADVQLKLLCPHAPARCWRCGTTTWRWPKSSASADPPEPLYFLKSPNSFSNPGETIVQARRPTARSSSKANWASSSAAAEHVSARRRRRRTLRLYLRQRRHRARPAQPRSDLRQWTRAKSYDTFGPFGPVVAPGLDRSRCRSRTRLNGRERQNYPAADMSPSAGPNSSA